MPNKILLVFCLLCLPFTARADSPTCNDGSATVGEGITKTLFLDCNDNDGDIDTVSFVTSAAHGSATAPVFNFGYTTDYTPDSTYSGSDSFTFRAQDLTLNLSNTATESLTVVQQPEGALLRYSGNSGCFLTDVAFLGCDDSGIGILGMLTAAMSPDGKNIYVVGNTDSSLGVLSRNTSTGALSQTAGTSGCFSIDGDGNDDGNPGECTVFAQLDDPRGVTVSPDGKNVYVAAFGSSAILIFDRNQTTGLLSNQRCISASGGACTTGHAAGLTGVDRVAVSPDGLYVYAAGNTNNTLSILSRNTSTGDLSQNTGSSGCISTTEATCTTAGFHAINTVTGLAFSPDGTQLYAGGYGTGVAILTRDTSTGALSQAAGASGCISTAGAGGCTSGRGIGTVTGITMSPDGKSLYVVTDFFGFAILDRDTGTGLLSQPAGTAGCINETGADGCVDGENFSNIYNAVVSNDGKSVYVLVNDNLADALVHAYARSSSGALTAMPSPFDCVSAVDGNCSPARIDGNSSIMLLSPDNLSAYVGITSNPLNAAGFNAFRRNVVPQCSDSSVSVVHGHSVNATLSCSDGNGETVTRQIVAAPGHGSLGTIDNTGGTVSYTAAASYTGSDQFTFTGSDGASGPAAAVNVTVTNQDPSCTPASVSGTGSGPIAINFSCSDPDSDSLQISASSPSGGTLGTIDQAASSVSYTPSSAGMDSFTFTATDGVSTTSPAAISITVGRAGTTLALTQLNVPRRRGSDTCGGDRSTGCRYQRRNTVQIYGTITSTENLAGQTATLSFSRERRRNNYVLQSQRLLTVGTGNTFSFSATGRTIGRGKWRIQASIPQTAFTPAAASAVQYFRIR